MNKRLSKTLKKQLEASLHSLTAKQAGKLYLLYLRDADGKPGGPKLVIAGQYSPIKELTDALVKQVDPMSPQSVARFNGYVFASMLAVYAQTEFSDRLDQLKAQAVYIYGRLEYLIVANQVSAVAEDVSQWFTYQSRPLQRAKYDQLLAWVKANGFAMLDEVAEEAAELSADALVSGEDLEAPLEDRRRLASDRLHFPFEEDEQLRRDWVADQGEDAVLTCYFDGDRDRLEHWLAAGGHTNQRQRAQIIEQQRSIWLDRLTQALEAGQLTGFDAVWLGELPYPVRVDATGQIPGWAALRQVWQGWLLERGYSVYQQPFPDATTRLAHGLKGDVWATPINTVFDLGGKLTESALNKEVGAFVDECRQLDWGRSLASRVDVAAVARFLTASASLLDFIGAPDVGSVDVTAFEAAENDVMRGVALLSRKLEASRDRLGLDPDAMLSPMEDDVQTCFFPSARVDIQNFMSRAISDRLDTLRLDYPAFFYSEDQRWSPLFGEFKTPLQLTIEAVGEAYGDLATIRLAASMLSEAFFDGLEIMTPSLERALTEVEDLLDKTAAVLDPLLKKLSTYPWGVDVDRLKPVRKAADETEALGVIARRILVDTWYGLNSVRPGASVDLGDGDFNVHSWLNARLDRLEDEGRLT